MGLCHSNTATASSKPSSKLIARHKSSSDATGGGGLFGRGGSNQWRKIRSSKNEETVVIHDPTPLAAAILFRQQMQNNNGCGGDGAAALERHNSSLRYPATAKAGKKMPSSRSSSSRDRSLTHPLLHPCPPLNKLDDVETSHFVLVHGGGFGAWCWYKTIALLERSGYKATAVDLTGSGVDSFDTNNITSLSHYVKPLTDFLQTLVDGEKVILVGHDFGGACISYAMERFPAKVSKAVFMAATMLSNGQSTLDIFSHITDTKELMHQAQLFIYANGNENPPTSIDLNKSLLRDLLFNHSPAKDVALACALMRPMPFAPVLEKLVLSELNYGSIRRFYIETAEDNAIPVTLQRRMIIDYESRVEKVFHLKGSDHSPFFSKPQALHKTLVQISMIH
ncbi:hypothetical protein DM860_005074 [Cuscuta australis]|uniref:AB hydrolase-1 domain-containing protein n=1 Tax=Cuscuta australis TaxID=267555 RepID=A0A328DMA6_9ASTE|nr:hypothetical protein DM860_005074 [Cuscuta australis]